MILKREVHTSACNQQLKKLVMNCWLALLAVSKNFRQNSFWKFNKTLFQILDVYFWCRENGKREKERKDRQTDRQAEENGKRERKEREGLKQVKFWFFNKKPYLFNYVFQKSNQISHFKGRSDRQTDRQTDIMKTPWKAYPFSFVFLVLACWECNLQTAHRKLFGYTCCIFWPIFGCCALHTLIKICFLHVFAWKRQETWSKIWQKNTWLRLAPKHYIIPRKNKFSDVKTRN